MQLANTNTQLHYQPSNKQRQVDMESRKQMIAPKHTRENTPLWVSFSMREKRKKISNFDLK